MNRRLFLAYGAIGITTAAYQACNLLTRPRRVASGPAPVYVITSACIKDGACADTCPVDAICRGDKQFYIDPEACIACGACVPACPAEAIYAADELPPEHAGAPAENRRMCRGA